MSLRTFVVTGGASGIAAEVVERLVARGDKVIVLDRVAPMRTNVRYIAVDLADPDSIAAAAEQIQEPLHGLANVAGVPGTGGSDLTMRINFLGLREFTRLLADRLVDGASIVSVASRAGHQWPLRLAQHVELARTASFDEGLQWLAEHPVSDNNAYPYSKEVLRVWTQLEATRLRDRSIRVNVINPGPVETPIIADFARLLGQDRMNDGIDRVGRAARPADIAPIIAWLLTDESAWINGADLATDGGLAATYVETPMHLQPGISTEFEVGAAKRQHEKGAAEVV